MADLQTKLNSFRHLSSHSLLFAAVISFKSGAGSLSFFLGWRSKMYLRLGHSRSGRFAVVFTENGFGLC